MSEEFKVRRSTPQYSYQSTSHVSECTVTKQTLRSTGRRIHLLLLLRYVGDEDLGVSVVKEEGVGVL